MGAVRAPCGAREAVRGLRTGPTGSREKILALPAVARPPAALMEATTPVLDWCQPQQQAFEAVLEGRVGYFQART
jgi:hypothetical protein